MSSLKINQFHFWSVENLISWKFRSFGHWKIRWVALQCRFKSQLTVFQCLPHKRPTSNQTVEAKLFSSLSHCRSNTSSFPTLRRRWIIFQPFRFFCWTRLFCHSSRFNVEPLREILNRKSSCKTDLLEGFYWQTNGSLFSCWETYLVRESRVTGKWQIVVQWSPKQLMDYWHFG